MNNPSTHQRISQPSTSTLSHLFLIGMIGSILLLGAGTSWADGDGHGYKHDPQSRLDKMTEKLDLTKEQQDKILPILQEKHQKMEGLHNQMKDVREQAMAEIEAQLNPEQKEKFQKSREKRREKMKEYKEKHKGGKGHGKGKHGKGDDHD